MTDNATRAEEIAAINIRHRATLRIVLDEHIAGGDGSFTETAQRLIAEAHGLHALKRTGHDTARLAGRLRPDVPRRVIEPGGR